MKMGSLLLIIIAVLQPADVSLTRSGGECPDAASCGTDPYYVASQLYFGFADADANGDGLISFEEAQAFSPSICRAAFDEIDLNSDEYLNLDELAIEMRPDEPGCCSFKFARDGDLLKALGDLFLLSLPVGALVVMQRQRRG